MTDKPQKSIRGAASDWELTYDVTAEFSDGLEHNDRADVSDLDGHSFEPSDDARGSEIARGAVSSDRAARS